MATRMQQRRGTAEQWETANPILAAGEIGFITDENQFKIGDGTSAWDELVAFQTAEDLEGSLDSFIELTEKGVALGVATLNESGQVPLSQLALLIDGAPELLDTLSELANAIDDQNGIVNTAIGNAVNPVISDLNALTATVNTLTDNVAAFGQDVIDLDDELTLDIQNAQANAETTASGYVSAHAAVTTNVHGISDTANLVYQADLSALTTDDIAEGTNEYYTDAKAIAANVSAIATAKSEAIQAATDSLNAVIASAPTALNTLDELAAALGDDANFASTVTTSLGNKVDSYTTIVPKTASYTLSSLTEKDNVVTVTSGSATTLTIPADSTLDFPIGTSLDVFQMGTGQVTLAGASGVTVNATPGLKFRTQYSTATIFKLAANTWIAYGDLKA